MKLTSEQLKEFNVRRLALQFSSVLIQMARREYGLFVNGVFQELGIEKDKEYLIDENTGEIKIKDDSETSREFETERRE